MTLAKNQQTEWRQLLIDAVEKPGMVLAAYQAFHEYSVGNQLLAMWQCQFRGLEVGPIATFKRWKALGRSVKKGSKAITLCMPVTCHREEENAETGEDEDRSFTLFVYRNNWFVLGQTEGEDFVPEPLPEWDAGRALKALDIRLAKFAIADGNTQGYATRREVAINPVAALPRKTLFHEVGHVLLGHTEQGKVTDGETLTRDLREAEAEGVALLCCEALGLEGPKFSRGYIQHWLKTGGKDAIPEKSAMRIMRVADQILRAGRPARQPKEVAK